MSITRMAWNAYREAVANGADRETARQFARRYKLNLQAIDRGGQIA